MSDRTAVTPLPGDASPGPARVQRADARRNLEAIIDAAMRLLPEQPAASMGQIAAEAGVHRATVHRHFAARDDLVAAVRQRAMEDSLEAVERALENPPPGAADRIEALTAAMLASGDRYRLYRFTTWRDERTVARSQEIAATIVPLLAAAQREGDVRTDLTPERLMVAYGGLVVAALPEIAAGSMTVDSAAAFIRAMLVPAAA